MAAADRDHGFLGYFVLEKTAGDGPVVTATEIPIMVGAVNPRNPNNIIYPDVVNKAAAASVRILGKKSPTIRVAGIPAKASWFTSNNLNTLILSTDSVGNSDTFAAAVHDGTGVRIYTGLKCAQVSMYHTAPSGVFVDLDFIGRYGDDEDAAPPAIAAPAVDGGNAYGPLDIAYNATASHIDLWRLTVQRGQGFNPYSDGTRYSDVIQSGRPGGILMLQQSPNATTVPTTAMTIDVGPSTTGVRMTLALSEDEAMKDVMPALLSKTRVYTLFNSTGALGLTIAAKPI